MRTTLPKTILLALLCVGASAPTASGATASSGGVSSAQPAPPPLPRTNPAHGAALATWFGPGFYGQRTACGQLLTPLVLGVANRTLPCGTLVSLAYRGRRAVVPVIDRGPYGANGAQWDLTSEAARALGIEDTARVAARVVGRVRNTPALGLPPAAPAPPTAALAGGAAATG